MQSHGPKRVYTPQSLEFWFGKLETDWSVTFSSSQLEIGRALYRDGEVRELELTDKDAIIHRRIEKRDEYAVIEWDDEDGLSVRSSTTDMVMARARAVAGLHEIEELVADEIPPLPGELAASNPAANGHGSANGNPRAAEPARAPNGPNHHPDSKIEAVMRVLLLVFKTKTAGLTFQAFWLEADGKTRHPALGAAAHANGNGHVSSGERAKLIGLAAYARKAHFHYNQESGVYLMESLVEIPNFLKVTLPAWRRIFTIELDDRSVNLL
ncbi:MAG: hypothetical protein ACHQ4G_02815 [Opitutales bacterium]